MINRVIKTFLIVPINLLTLFLLIALVSCGRDNVELPEEVLQGQVNGEEWELKSANAFLQSSDFTYKVTFLSTQETISDPCNLRTTANRHVSAFMRFPDFSGDYTVAPQLVTNREVVVTFNANISQSITATSGFMSIFALENRVALGYLQAVLDDNNTVEGSFEIRICD